MRVGLLKRKLSPFQMILLGFAVVILLGALSTKLDNIADDAWQKAIQTCVKPKFVDLNLKAFYLGRDLAANA